MNNWEKTTLGEVCDTISSTYKKNNEKIVLINTSDVLNGKVLNHEFVQNINIKGQFKKTFIKDDILYSEIRPQNKRFAYVDFDSKNYIASTKLMVLRYKENVLPKFLYLILSSNNVINNLQAIAETRSGTFPQITYNELSKIEINLPPLDEQKRIADVLSALDDKIEVNNKINENLEAQAQAIFKQWFVDFEFPDSEGKPYKTNGGKFIDSELGEIPEGWKVDSADNIFDISIGKTPPRKEPIWFSKDKIDVKWVSIADMGREGVFISNSSEYLTREAIKKFNVVVVPENTVLLSFKLTVGRISITDGEVTTNEAIAHFKTDNKTYTNYIYQYLKVYDYQSMGNTSSIANAVNSKIIKVMKIVLPSDYTLERFYDIVNPIMVKIKNKQKENRNLSEIRDSLLPRLVNGEVRV